jgi:hypothetical protein
MLCVISTDHTITSDTLMGLSNASRLEAIQAFEQLSGRLPQSARSLTPSNKAPGRHAHSSKKRKTKKALSAKGAHHSHSQSAPSLLITTASDHPRPRHTHTKSRSSSSSPKNSKPRATSDKHRFIPSRKAAGDLGAAPSPSSTRTSSRSERRRAARSVTTDSTKLGEIPEHKRAGLKDDSSLRVSYPLYAYPAPQKQRSRFMRFFGK